VQPRDRRTPPVVLSTYCLFYLDWGGEKRLRVAEFLHRSERFYSRYGGGQIKNETENQYYTFNNFILNIYLYYKLTIELTFTIIYYLLNLWFGAWNGNNKGLWLIVMEVALTT